MDDAIVMTENIYIHIRRNFEAGNSWLIGKNQREIFFAVISTTITLATVFIPDCSWKEPWTSVQGIQFVVAGFGYHLFFCPLTFTLMLATKLCPIPGEKQTGSLEDRNFEGMNRVYSLRSTPSSGNVSLPFCLPSSPWAHRFIYGEKFPGVVPLEDRSQINIEPVRQKVPYEYIIHTRLYGRNQHISRPIVPDALSSLPAYQW